MQRSVWWLWDQTDIEECAGIVTVSIITCAAAVAAAFILCRVKQNSRESSVVFQEALGLAAAPIEASRKSCH